MTVTQATTDDVQQLQRLAEAVSSLRHQVGQRIVGQEEPIQGILTAILAGGHALLIGVPGLAKTLMISTVAEALALTFHRIQFTPDLMPSDITGTEIIEEDHTTGKRVVFGPKWSPNRRVLTPIRPLPLCHPPGARLPTCGTPTGNSAPRRSAFRRW